MAPLPGLGENPEGKAPEFTPVVTALQRRNISDSSSSRFAIKTDVRSNTHVVLEFTAIHVFYGPYAFAMGRPMVCVPEPSALVRLL